MIVEIKTNPEQFIKPKVGDILKSHDGLIGIYVGFPETLADRNPLRGTYFYVLCLSVLDGKCKMIHFPKHGCTFFTDKLTIENDDSKRV